MLGNDEFVPFFEHAFPRLVLLVMKLGATRAEAEEVAQEALTQAYERREKIDSPHAWVRTVATRTYLKTATQARTRTAASTADPAAGAAYCDPDLVVLQDEQRRVLECFRRLPPEQRKVAALYYDGLTHEEIAEAIAKPLSTVRSLLRHARNRLKEEVGIGRGDSVG